MAEAYGLICRSKLNDLQVQNFFTAARGSDEDYAKYREIRKERRKSFLLLPTRPASSPIIYSRRDRAGPTISDGKIVDFLPD